MSPTPWARTVHLLHFTNWYHWMLLACSAICLFAIHRTYRLASTCPNLLDGSWFPLHFWATTPAACHFCAKVVQPMHSSLQHNYSLSDVGECVGNWPVPIQGPEARCFELSSQIWIFLFIRIGCLSRIILSLLQVMQRPSDVNHCLSIKH